MIISDFYQTRIEASSYEVNIDSNTTVITVTLVDFNGTAVSGKSVTLTCNKGYFNKNGSNAIDNNTTKSITATTDSDGKITGTWTASEWGLCTFTTTNSFQPAHIQVYVKGIKLLQTVGNIYVRGNENTIFLSCESVNFNCGAWNDATLGTINSAYAPPAGSSIAVAHYTNPDIVIRITPEGLIVVRNNSNQNLTNQKVTTTISYTRK